MLATLCLALTSAPGAPSPTQFTEVQRVHGADGLLADRFGQSLDIEGDVMVVGAYGRDDVDPQNAFCISGAAYVFERQGGAWTQTAKLTASDADCRAFFGFTVATDGESIVVGAYENDHATSLGATNCNGGAAYVFVRSAAGWVEEQRVVPSTWDCGLEFGKALAIEGDELVVSAPSEPDGLKRGAVYAFERSGSVWTETQRMTRSTTGGIGTFGSALALERGTLIVGSMRAGAQSLGEVHTFERGASGWEPTQVLGPTGGLSYGFGSEVALSGHTLAVSLTGDNAPRNSVYLYERSAGVWSYTRPFQGPLRSVDTYTYFAWDIDLDGDTLVVGDSAADDANGSQTCYSGAVYVYERTGPDGFADWRERYVLASNPACDDYFGNGVALDGDRLVLGGDFAPGATPGSGAAAVLERPGLGDVLCIGNACPCGNSDPRGGCQNSTGRGARLRATGTANLSADRIRLRATDLPEGSFGLFVAGLEQPPTMYGDSLLCVAGPGHRFLGQVARTDQAATLILDRALLDSGGTVMVGVPAVFQCVFRDFPTAGCGAGLGSTNALRILPF